MNTQVHECRSPIYVMARNIQVAKGFVATDLHEDPRRLRFVDRPVHLQGLERILLYVLPCATWQRDYHETMSLAKIRGYIIATVDDQYARARYAAR